MSTSADEIPTRAQVRDAAAGLAERLLRLPSGHPSGADAEPAPAERDPQEGEPEQRDPEGAVGHLPWPEDWVHRGGGPAEAGDAAGAGDDPELLAHADGQPGDAEPGAGQPEAGHSAPADAEPWSTGGPYRPWFTVGDVPEPWFASEPERPSSPGPGG